MTNETSKQILGHGITYLVSGKLEGDQTSWSSSYQCPIISSLAFFQAEGRVKELGALVNTFKPILNVYSAARPESEEVYLLREGIVQIGKSSLVETTGDDFYSDRFRIILRPMGNRLADLSGLARELGLPHNFPNFKMYYKE